MVVQRQRQKDFAMSVANRARVDAFHVAKDCLEIFRDDPEKVARHQEMIHKIMTDDRDDDTDPAEMPALEHAV